MNRNILNHSIENLTPTENKLLDYIEENIHRIETMNIYQLADNAGVSTATISRISKKMGYSNFNKLKIEIAKSKYDDLLNAHFTPSDSIDDISTKLIHSITISNQQTVSFLNLEELEAAVKLLQSASRIYLFGVGASGIVCSDFYYKLSRIGKTCIFAQDTHIQMANIATAGNGDLAIGISYSGMTKEVVEPLRFAKENGVSTITITGTGKNQLADLADITFRIPRHEHELRVGAITSRSNSLFLTDLLYLALIQDHKQEITAILEQTKHLTQAIR
ncbi:MurR/RpiR family transcriptional regulator [Streptococcus suis]